MFDEANFQPIRSITQFWVVTRHQYGTFALAPQTSFRGKAVVGVGTCQQLPQAISDPSSDFVSFCLLTVEKWGKGLYDRSLSRRRIWTAFSWCLSVCTIHAGVFNHLSKTKVEAYRLVIMYMSDCSRLVDSGGKRESKRHTKSWLPSFFPCYFRVRANLNSAVDPTTVKFRK